MKKSISILAIAALISGCSSADYSNLQGNSAPISSTYNSSDYSKLTADLAGNRVFLAGEQHGIKENYTLRLNLLMFLHENAGVKYYLAEMGYSSSYFINKYLDTGNKDYLLLVANSIKGSYDYSEEDFIFWEKLYMYNQRLPKRDQIKVIGIDIEHQFWLSIMQLNDILEDKDLGHSMSDTQGRLEYFSAIYCPQISDTKDIMKNAKTLPVKDVIELLAEIRTDFEKYPGKYEVALSKAQFKDFKFALSNITATERIYLNRNNQKYFFDEREKSIYQNFLKAEEMHPNSKFFGQLGSFHVLQKSDNDEKRFAEYLNDPGSPVKDKVISIKYIYDNNQYKTKNHRLLNALKEYGNSKFTLYNFKTIGDDSKGLCPVITTGQNDIFDFFQYGILIREPQRVTLMDPETEDSL